MYACAEGVGGDLVESGGRLGGGKRGELISRLLPLLDERGVGRPGIVLLDQPTTHLRRGPPDLPVQIGDERVMPLALGGGVVDGRGCESIDGALDQHLNVVPGKGPVLPMPCMAVFIEGS